MIKLPNWFLNWIARLEANYKSSYILPDTFIWQVDRIKDSMDSGCTYSEAYQIEGFSKRAADYMERKLNDK